MTKQAQNTPDRLKTFLESQEAINQNDIYCLPPNKNNVKEKLESKNFKELISEHCTEYASLFIPTMIISRKRFCNFKANIKAKEKESRKKYFPKYVVIMLMKCSIHNIFSKYLTTN
ncbi:hypothetical protein AVEN_179429-1 [Araneus ventricosus]|uniref:Uncharacterized protein n=1 Tax=Araneus ventricosus TaxID=182803 RepID=A0A4Y2BGU8_ARAVE|nr:hypothetical protein AVEN_179429-1 [Araneus ventricosus]